MIVLGQLVDGIPTTSTSTSMGSLVQIDKSVSVISLLRSNHEVYKLTTLFTMPQVVSGHKVTPLQSYDREKVIRIELDKITTTT